MAITRLNHAVLYVRDIARTKKFYSEVLGLEAMIEDASGRYLFMRAPGSHNHHDIAFFAVGDGADRKSTRLNSSHEWISRMPSSA